MSWFYKTDDTEHGPVSADDIKALYRANTISSKTKIKEDDSFAWRQLDQTELGKELGIFTEVIETGDGAVIEVDASKVRKIGWRYIGFQVTVYLIFIPLFVALFGAAYQASIVLKLDGSNYDFETLELTGLIYGLGLLVMTVLSVPALIFYAFTVHRAMKNVRYLGASETSISPPWTWGFLFIPFMNLVKPFQAVSEIWTASHRLAGQKETGNWQMTLWWGTWLGSAVLMRIADFFIAAGWSSNIDNLTPGAIALVISLLIAIISNVMVLNVLGRIRNLQNMFGNANIADEF